MLHITEVNLWLKTTETSHRLLATCEVRFWLCVSFLSTGVVPEAPSVSTPGMGDVMIFPVSDFTSLALSPTAEY
jgi:hypothetical protein